MGLVARVEMGSLSVAEAVEAEMVKAGAAGEAGEEELVDFVVQVVLDPSYLLGSSTDCLFQTVHHG